jgi:hypothetical protein
MKSTLSPSIILLLSLPSTLINAFSITKPQICTRAASASSLQMAPGGWGIGNPLDFKEEEFSSNQSKKRRRRRRKDATDGEVISADEVAYSAESSERMEKMFGMEDTMQFKQRVQQERDNLQLQKKKDLMEIAKMAGLGDRMKTKIGREENKNADSNKFDFEDDDDDLDVRVQWEE